MRAVPRPLIDIWVANCSLSEHFAAQIAILAAAPPS
jgi:hypothetical protein